MGALIGGCRGASAACLPALASSAAVQGHLRSCSSRLRRSTLDFARRAKKVVNKACVNEVKDDSVVLRRQAKEIEELRAQIAELQAAGWVPCWLAW